MSEAQKSNSPFVGTPIAKFGRRMKNQSASLVAAKGWAYYSHNAFFWAKIMTFRHVNDVAI